MRHISDFGSGERACQEAILLMHGTFWILVLGLAAIVCRHSVSLTALWLAMFALASCLTLRAMSVVPGDRQVH